MYTVLSINIDNINISLTTVKKENPTKRPKVTEVIEEIIQTEIALTLISFILTIVTVTTPHTFFIQIKNLSALWLMRTTLYKNVLQYVIPFKTNI